VLARWGSKALVARNGRAQSHLLLTEADLDKLRSLRADLASLVAPGRSAGRRPLLPSASVSVRVGADGAALLGHAATETAGSAGSCSSRTFTAQRLDVWRRLKLCRNDRCACRSTIVPQQQCGVPRLP